MEYKRAAVMLPSILKRALLLAAVCLLAAGIIAFGAGILREHNDGEARLRVGYRAEMMQYTPLAAANLLSASDAHT